MSFLKKTNCLNSKGKKEGYWERYWVEGKIFAKGNYTNGNKEGLWKYYFYNDQILATENYSNGSREGLCKYYYPNGNLFKEVCYKNNKVVGWVILYDENTGRPIEKNFISNNIMITVNLKK